MWQFPGPWLLIWAKRTNVVVAKMKQIVSIFVLLTWYKACTKAASFGAALQMR